ncbi:MAG: hypothetical protein DRR08_01835 [Candidatus Parabeggiatoa sp. nov. 2]|nr:MAG: hypothetical protein B6247_04660 [Beggiatoa sp. 4572_84]RKZ64024.1 MAG: hypothetical protein DRR08_01835 [Gammaproteobacteria bacterium]HEC83874.1 hypothetical protein [Thioploca sp.]
MNAIRLILLALLAWILWKFSQRWYQNAKLSKKDNKPPPPPLATQKHEVMVRCDYCGLYLPSSEAISSGEAHYCCEAHLNCSVNRDQ